MRVNELFVIFNKIEVNTYHYLNLDFNKLYEIILYAMVVFKFLFVIFNKIKVNTYHYFNLNFNNELIQFLYFNHNFNKFQKFLYAKLIFNKNVEEVKFFLAIFNINLHLYPLFHKLVKKLKFILKLFIFKLILCFLNYDNLLK